MIQLSRSIKLNNKNVCMMKNYIVKINDEVGLADHRCEIAKIFKFKQLVKRLKCKPKFE